MPRYVVNKLLSIARETKDAKAPARSSLIGLLRTVPGYEEGERKGSARQHHQLIPPAQASASKAAALDIWDRTKIDERGKFFPPCYLPFAAVSGPS